MGLSPICEPAIRESSFSGCICHINQETEVANRVPAFGLANQGIETSAKVHWNLGHSALVEQAVTRGEGILAKDGPLVVETGKHTGRSAKDKFLVRDAETESTIWWDNNKSMTAEHFAALKQDFLAELAGRRTLCRRPLRRLSARAPGPGPGRQRARLAQPLHPHFARPPRGA
jgi:hypothetical protein